MRARHLLAAALALLNAVAAHASETVTYTYDAKGRLINVAHAGGPNDGVTSSYSFDAADNRKSVTTRSGLVVVPLNGMTVIPLSAG